MGVSVGGFRISDDGDLKVARTLRELLAEFLGTFYLIFIGCGGVAGATAANPGGGTTTSAAVLQIAFAFGLGIGGSVHLFSDISGGQFNPAVSLGLFFAKQMSLFKVVLYFLFQLGGGLVACAILRAMLDETPGVVNLGPNISPASGLFIELFGTLFLVLTVLATTNSKRNHAPSYLQPLSIGIAIFVLHMFLVSTTGCGINPVRSFVTNVVDNKIRSNFWVYIIGPFLASLIGGILYEFIFSSHYKVKRKEEDRSTVYKNGTEENPA